MKHILQSYVDQFNLDDIEYYKQDIPNAKAEAWLNENIPLIEVPDKTIEEAYYFRWWTFRKHIKSTGDGYVITEFLPPVSWAGTHNTIIAPVGHHISEGKWLKCGKTLLSDYMKFWLEEKSKTYLYSTWFLDSILEYCNHNNDFSFGIEHLDLMIRYYETFAAEHQTKGGLFWSFDSYDAMEYSISGGSRVGVLSGKNGVRPTLNSYMAANALAISVFAEKAGKLDVAEEYRQKYIAIRDRMNDVLWDGSFYKAIHTDNLDAPSLDEVPASQNVKELIGYLPWCFNLAPKGRESAFAELKKKDGFWTEYGLATAEQRHPCYLFEATHECLWNGYIWPFATSQVLKAVKNLLDNYDQTVMDNQDFYEILHTYAKSHERITADGKRVCWIDEVKHPETNEWSSRKLLEEWGWKEEKGGLERGKDYNHSTFCDIVLGGLLGVSVKDGEVSVSPHIPEEWEHFAIDNLWLCGKCYKIFYDKTGTKYGHGKGITVLEKETV
ncbi:MAG: hypothetical protein J6A56_01030 [Clostridia bacterium]|nr:hypothetical protein [Clostridia bacterium]